MIFYVIKKNRVYYHGTLNIGLKKKHDYTDYLPTAKFYEEEIKAQQKADELNKENTLDYLRGTWKVKKVSLEEL